MGKPEDEITPLNLVYSNFHTGKAKNVSQCREYDLFCKIQLNGFSLLANEVELQLYITGARDLTAKINGFI